MRVASTRFQASYEPSETDLPTTAFGYLSFARCVAAEYRFYSLVKQGGRIEKPDRAVNGHAFPHLDPGPSDHAPRHWRQTFGGLAWIRGFRGRSWTKKMRHLIRAYGGSKTHYTWFNRQFAACLTRWIGSVGANRHMWAVNFRPDPSWLYCYTIAVGASQT